MRHRLYHLEQEARLIAFATEAPKSEPEAPQTPEAKREENEIIKQLDEPTKENVEKAWQLATGAAESVSGFLKGTYEKGKQVVSSLKNVIEKQGESTPVPEQPGKEDRLEAPKTQGELLQYNLDLAREHLAQAQKGEEKLIALVEYVSAMFALMQATWEGRLGEPLNTSQEDSENTPADTASAETSSNNKQEGEKKGKERASEKLVAEVQNPKTEAEKLRNEQETMDEKEKTLEAEYQSLRQQIDALEGKLGEDTDEKSRDAIEELKDKQSDISQELDAVEDKQTEAEKRVTELEKEQKRREDLISTEWKNVEKLPDAERLVQSVELGGDGDDIIITLNSAAGAEALVGQITNMKTKGFENNGIEAQGNKIIARDIEPRFFTADVANIRQQGFEILGKAALAARETTRQPSEIQLAKDAPEGQIREDTEGNFWIKNKEGMWSSYEQDGMKSDAGFANTQWGDSLMDERTKRVVEQPTEKLQLAKNAPVGQVREDTGGNYWVKNPEGMWDTYNNPEAKLQGPDNFRGTTWGSQLIDERTKRVVDVPANPATILSGGPDPKAAQGLA